MQDVVIGRVLRALRRRRGWRQSDLAARADVSQAMISLLERGHVARTNLDTLRRVFTALEARLELVASWRGAEIDRLLDQEHAALVAHAAGRLERLGWEVVLEVTYSAGGERGSIDLLGLRADRLAAVVVEVKSAIPSSEATGRKLDEKARLTPAIVRSRVGWTPTSVARVLVVPDTMRLRRLLIATDALRRMLPGDFSALRRWLRDPAGGVAAVWFLSDIRRSVGRERRGGSQRVRSAALRWARAGGSHRKATEARRCHLARQPGVGERQPEDSERQHERQ
jgi:transcriptional regulator with XRE-family HTH domain